MADRFLFQPFRFGARDAASRRGLHNGLAVTDDADRHLRDKILAALFTAPGERVNSPRFGVGLDREVFEPVNDLQLAAIEYRIFQGLRRDLGGEVIVHSVDIGVPPTGGELRLEIRYERRSDRRPRNLEIVL